MKYLLIIAILLTKQTTVSCQFPVAVAYRAEYVNTKFLNYDSTQKPRVIVEGAGKSAAEQKEMADFFPRAFVTSISYTYDVVSQSIGKDSSRVTWQHFKPRSNYLKINFSTQEYIYTNGGLFKRSGNDYLDVRDLKNSKNYSLWYDSVIATPDTIEVNGYKCTVAVSAFEQDRKYYICHELPRSINPGVWVVNATGAVLGIKSDTYTAVLKKITPVGK